MTPRKIQGVGAYHYAADLSAVSPENGAQVDKFTYTFENFFHPFVEDMIAQVNEKSLAGLFDPVFQAKIVAADSENYSPNTNGGPFQVEILDKVFDVTPGGPYACYNWEIFFHIPLMIAVHLSSNQRFPEAQKWFHYVFDPTSTDQSVPPPQRFWKFKAFRTEGAIESIDALLQLMSTPDSQLDTTQLQYKLALQTGYTALLTDPYSPHVVARTRISSYQYYVVMKYLDNLIAWGDNLFLQDTIETLNEATLCYVLAADILGPRPQALPERGAAKPQNFKRLSDQLDAMSSAMVELESQFPFNLMPAPGHTEGSSDPTGTLFGIGRSLYFCVPPNPTLLGYWDIVADRLFKIRNSQNIQGIFQQLPLFDPPIDPGLLVKAAAAGVDITSVVSGLNQPPGPVRCLVLIQKALELASEVRGLGNTLLSAIEKGDAERLGMMRQGHEVTLQQMTQSVRFLQWKQAQEATDILLKSRDTTLERYTYYLALLGLSPNATTVPPAFTPDRRELTESNFDDAHSALVGVYDQNITLQEYPDLQLAESSSPSNQSGASGVGQLYLNRQEDDELNGLLPRARDAQLVASLANVLASSLTPIPSVDIHVHFWGLGASSEITSGSKLAAATKYLGDAAQIYASWEQAQAGIVSRTAGYQRRAREWILQANLAARELMQIGRQILGSLIAEQVAYHEYNVIKSQVQQAQAVQQFMSTKFTNTAFYSWMQGQSAGLYYQYYRFACDVARKAEQTMKQELMRPELDATTFVQFNYWDTGHQGLLSGEALYLDIKRMEMAYHDNNKRELELTRHVSLRQLDPLALLTFKITGSCTVTIPEWLYDRDCPGHYMRRIRSVSLSVPSVAGPYTGINCTLSLLRSSVRTSPLLTNNRYARAEDGADERFVDYFGSVDSIVTSSGSDDSGLFETNLRDERFLPFEGAGAISTWTLSLPEQLRAFDYMTISDVILHLRYTARSAGAPMRSQATKELLEMLKAAQSGQALMFCLRFDFPSQWYAFVTGTTNFALDLTKDLFPYTVQSARQITIDAVTLYSANAVKVASLTPTVDLGALSSGLSAATGTASLSLPADATVMTRDPNQQVFLIMQYHFGL
jgi:hypothetical protein